MKTLLNVSGIGHQLYAWQLYYIPVGYSYGLLTQLLFFNMSQMWDSL